MLRSEGYTREVDFHPTLCDQYGQRERSAAVKWSTGIPFRPERVKRRQVNAVEAKVLAARWDREMDELLREGVLRYGDAWEEVSTHMTPHECPKEEVEKRCVCVVVIHHE